MNLNAFFERGKVMPPPGFFRRLAEERFLTEIPARWLIHLRNYMVISVDEYENSVFPLNFTFSDGL
jgi:hypothetical protein